MDQILEEHIGKPDFNVAEKIDLRGL